MSFRRPVSWFLTETGRGVMRGVMCAGGSLIVAINYFPHTFFLSNYVDFVHLYKSGSKASLAPELTERFEKCLDVLNLNSVHRKLAKSFAVYGFDLFSAGNFGSRYGVAIGIPSYFTYKSPEDVQKQDIQVNLKSVDWSSDAGTLLSKSLVLSEKAQKFSLCREILFSQTYKLYYDMISPALVTLLIYGVANHNNNRLQMFQRPPMVRYTFYGLVSLFGLGIYFLGKDTSQVYYETGVDEQLANLGPDFIEGGIEFYSKIMKRNMALRELMGNEGEKKYSINGNENYLIRNVRQPLNLRKKYFETRLKELQSKQEEIQ